MWLAETEGEEKIPVPTARVSLHGSKLDWRAAINFVGGRHRRGFRRKGSASHGCLFMLLFFTPVDECEDHKISVPVLDRRNRAVAPWLGNHEAEEEDREEIVLSNYYYYYISLSL